MTAPVDINDITAGMYQLVVLRWDEITSKPNEPFTYVRHHQGDEVNLSEDDARRLFLAGAIVRPGEVELALAQAARAQYEAALAALPNGLRQQLLEEQAAAVKEAVDAALEEQTDSDNDPPIQPAGFQEAGAPVLPLARPALTATRAVWANYALARKADPVWVNDPVTTRQQLIDAVGSE